MNLARLMRSYAITRAFRRIIQLSKRNYGYLLLALYENNSFRDVIKATHKKEKKAKQKTNIYCILNL